MPIFDLRKVPIRPTKSAHLTYKKCPSDLRKMPIRPTKSAHPTYEKCPSDLRKRPIRPTNLSKRQLKVGRMHQYNVFNLPIRPTVHRTYHSCKNHVFVGRMGSIEGMGVGPKIHHRKNFSFFSKIVIKLQ